MSRQSVLHIITGLETGGAETSLVRLVASTRDVDHHVVSLTTRGTQAALLEHHGAAVTTMDWARGRIGMRGLRNLIQRVRRDRPDVIHGWMYHANLVATFVALGTGMRRRLVWSVRHSLDDLAHESRALRIVIRISALLSRLPARILYNSERSRQQHEAAGFARSRSSVVANGFDTTRFAPDAARRASMRQSLGITPETLIVGLIARVHPLKDHVTFLECAARVRAIVPNVRFLLAGRGTDDDAGVVAQSIERLGLRDSMILLGDRADVEAIYNACDAAVLTSSSEAFPNTIGEAMASGVPCVSTDVGDAAFIIGDTGCVIHVGDIDGLVAAWVSLLENTKAERQRLGTDARARIVRDFSLERSRDAHQDVWNALAERASRRDDRAGISSMPLERPIRVLHVLTASMSLNFLRGQREYFASRNIDLHVASSAGPELETWAAQHPGTAHAIPMQRRIAPLADLVSLAQLVRLIRASRFDVVHAGTPKGGLLGMLAASICRVPVRIYHLRGLPLSTATGVRRVTMRLAERLAVAASTHVVAVSNSLREAVHGKRIADRGQVLLIGAGSSNGVDAHGRFNPDLVSQRHVADIRAKHGIPPESPIVGFVGRLSCDKGIVELLDAWRTVRASHGNARLLVVGIEDDASDTATQVLAGLRADPRVHLHGKDWDTPPLYAAMDLLVLPTYREGFPNVLLEAGAMRLPVVATLVPGCVDAVEHDVTGMLVPARDSKALAEAITRYLVNPAMRASHGLAARTRIIELFDQQVIWNGYAALYGRAAVDTAVCATDTSVHAVGDRRAA